MYLRNVSQIWFRLLKHLAMNARKLRKATPAAINTDTIGECLFCSTVAACVCSDAPLEITVMAGVLNVDTVRRLADLGVDRVIASVPPRDYIGGLHRFHDEVMSKTPGYEK